MTDPNTLTRLDNLERQNRRLRRAVSALGLSLAALATLGFVRPGPATTPVIGQDIQADTVTAKELILVNEAGDQLGTLGVDSQGFPMFLLRKDKSSAVITLNNPSLALRGDDGKRGAWIGQDTQGGMGVSLNSERVTDGVRIKVKPDGASGVYVLAEDGRERVALERLTDGSAAASVRDGRGLPRSFLGMDPSGSSSLLLLDENGAKRAGLVVQPGGAPLLSLDDERGQSRIELSQRFDGHSRIRTFDEDGNTTSEAP